MKKHFYFSLVLAVVIMIFSCSNESQNSKAELDNSVVEQHYKRIDSLMTILINSGKSYQNADELYTLAYEIQNEELKLSAEIMRQRSLRLKELDSILFSFNINDSSTTNEYKQAIKGLAFMEGYGWAVFYNQFMGMDFILNSYKNVLEQ